jgi:hypothetical protein
MKPRFDAYCWVNKSSAGLITEVFHYQQTSAPLKTNALFLVQPAAPKKYPAS